MDDRSRAIRTVLKETAPQDAIMFILSFDLQEDEERCIIESEVRGKSVQQISMECCVCPETVKRWRKSAFRKIASAIGA